MDYKKMLDEAIIAKKAKEKELQTIKDSKAEILLKFYKDLTPLFKEINSRVEKPYFTFEEHYEETIKEESHLINLIIFHGNFSRYFVFGVDSNYKAYFKISTSYSGGDSTKHFGIENASNAVINFMKDYNLI